MKNQALSSSKDKSKKLKCRLLQFLSSALRVNFVQPVPGLQTSHPQLKQLLKQFLYYGSYTMVTKSLWNMVSCLSVQYHKMKMKPENLMQLYSVKVIPISHF